MLGELFETPGVLRVFVLSILGRLPGGAISLVLILRTRELTGSYAAGGLVAGTSALAHAVGGPVLGRIVDRRGQTGVLVAAGLGECVALVAFALLPQGAPLGAAVGCAALAGFAAPPLIACLRTLWGSQIEDEQLRHAAFSLESAAFEMVYIVGPLLFVGLIGSMSLAAAAAACGIVAGVGAWLFAASPASRDWRPSGERSDDLAGALRGPGVRLILLALFAFGIAIGAIEIGAAAFVGSDEAQAAVLLALWGTGSAVGGFVAARRPAPPDPPRRLAFLLAALAVLTAPLALAGSVPVLGALLVLAGVAIAPSLATAFGLLGQVAPAGTVTEAFTWVATGFGGGIAIGAAAGGWLVEGPGTSATFLLAAAALGATAAVAFGSVGTLRHERHAVTAVPAPA